MIELEQDRLNQLLIDTVSLLCKNGLTFRHYMKIEGVIGITVDDNVFIVHINERDNAAKEEGIDNGGGKTDSTATQGVVCEDAAVVKSQRESGVEGEAPKVEVGAVVKREIFLDNEDNEDDAYYGVNNYSHCHGNNKHPNNGSFNFNNEKPYRTIPRCESYHGGSVGGGMMIMLMLMMMMMMMMRMMMMVMMMMVMMLLMVMMMRMMMMLMMLRMVMMVRMMMMMMTSPCRAVMKRRRGMKRTFRAFASSSHFSVPTPPSFFFSSFFPSPLSPFFPSSFSSSFFSSFSSFSSSFFFSSSSSFSFFSSSSSPFSSPSFSSSSSFFFFS